MMIIMKINDDDGGNHSNNIYNKLTKIIASLMLNNEYCCILHKIQ